MIDYDEKHDMLYVAIGDKTNSYGDDSEDDVLVMRDFDTDRITGFTISSIAKKIGLQPVVYGRWILPRKELPPDGEEVLVLTQSKKGIRNIDKGYWEIDHFIHRGTAQVIGWMRLPDMYLSEEEQNERC